MKALQHTLKRLFYFCLPGRGRSWNHRPVNVIYLIKTFCYARAQATTLALQRVTSISLLPKGWGSEGDSRRLARHKQQLQSYLIDVRIRAIPRRGWSSQWPVVHVRILWSCEGMLRWMCIAVFAWNHVWHWGTGIIAYYILENCTAQQNRIKTLKQRAPVHLLKLHIFWTKYTNHIFDGATSDRMNVAFPLFASFIGRKLAPQSHFKSVFLS